MKKLNSYTIYAIVELNIGITIKAESFKDALEHAKELKETDFVEPLSEYNDGNIRIESIFDENVKLKSYK